MPRVAFIKGIILGDVMAKKDGGGIQQAAGLIRYFDEESEDAIQISKGTVYLVCVVFSLVVYLANEPSPEENVWNWIWDKFSVVF